MALPSTAARVRRVGTTSLSPDAPDLRLRSAAYGDRSAAVIAVTDAFASPNSSEVFSS